MKPFEKCVHCRNLFETVFRVFKDLSTVTLTWKESSTRKQSELEKKLNPNPEDTKELRLNTGDVVPFFLKDGKLIGQLAHVKQISRTQVSRGWSGKSDTEALAWVCKLLDNIQVVQLQIQVSCPLLSICSGKYPPKETKVTVTIDLPLKDLPAELQGWRLSKSMDKIAKDISIGIPSSESGSTDGVDEAISAYGFQTGQLNPDNMKLFLKSLSRFED